ncbi:unnamed protein product [Somion occarium]|uniref:Uncharacterized protein n=1 Tax=Somion occarium TaxID=3059160 RepID=A0ABP1DJ59_9APHY
MHRATSSTKHTRRPPRDRLLKSLQACLIFRCRLPSPHFTNLITPPQILGHPGTPLPPALLTPPPSRSTSPALGGKRKSESEAQPASHKRPRLSPAETLQRPQNQTSSSSHSRLTPSQTLRSDPSEEGELREDLPQVSGSSSGHNDSDVILNANLPIRRPRRGVLDESYFQNLQRKYEKLGHEFRASAVNRLRSVYPPSHPEYRALSNPPPVNSSYHTHGALIARLEWLDSLLCFSYSTYGLDTIWLGRIHAAPESERDTIRGNYKQVSTQAWDNFASVLKQCKSHWQPTVTTEEHERMLYGLCCMIEAFGYQKRADIRAQPLLDQDMHYWKRFRMQEEELKQRMSESAPRMLPSPESISASSANSTPAGRSAGTPDHSERRPAENKITPLPLLQHNPDPNLTLRFGPNYVYQRRNFESSILCAGDSSRQAQKYLTIPAMAKHFPRTFTRMVNSSYSYTDEAEPDMEDDDGELMWPGQFSTGNSLGWLCNMGRAMVREYGKSYGYVGSEALIPDPTLPVRAQR